MSSTYTPDGQTPPVPGYVLPQDVLDDVIVETVNIPFTAAADNIAWVLLMLGPWASPVNFGAAFDGVTDDTVAWQDALAYLAGLGFGTLFVPEGNSLIAGQLDWPATVNMYAAPGAVLTQGHATSDTFNFLPADTSTDARLQWWGSLRIEAKSSGNTGTVFTCDIGPARALLGNVVVNVNGFFSGRMLTAAGSAYFTLNGVELYGNHTDSPLVQNGVGGLLEINGGKIKALNANFNDYLVSASVGKVQISGLDFDMLACTAGNAVGLFASSLAETIVEGCRFLGDAGQLNEGIVLAAGADIHSSNHRFEDVIPYSGGTAADGSCVELVPNVLGSIAGTTYTAPAYVASIMLQSSNVNAPTITLPAPLFVGQPLDMMIANVHGSGSWASAIGFTYPDGVAYTEAGGLSTVPDGAIASLRFVAAQPGSDLIWVQIGAAAQHFIAS